MAPAPFDASAEEFLRLGPELFGLEAGHEAVGLSAALSLLGKQGFSVPFVARYRRDETGGLDAVALEALDRAHERFCKLTAEKNRVVRALAEKSPRLAARGFHQLAAATSSDEVRAVALELGAVEAGGGERSRFARAVKKCPQLLAVAQDILSTQSAAGAARDRKLLAQLRSAAKDVVEDSEWQLTANDVLAHLIASDERVKASLRALYWNSARAKVTLRGKRKRAESPGKGKRERSKGESITSVALVGFVAQLRNIEHHKWMAIRRGLEAKELGLTIEPQVAEDRFFSVWQQRFGAWPDSELRRLLLDASADAWKRLVRPALERGAKRRLTLAAEEASTAVFARNLRDLLRSPGLGAHKALAQAVVIGVDPGHRHGCKCAAVGPNGAVLGTCVFNSQDRAEALRALSALACAHRASVFAVGNGTGVAKAAAVVAELCRPPHKRWYVLVNEAGASVYSVSAAARAEFPALDPLLVSAVSIARRLQDPMCELVKYEPSSLGVGQYQKDLPPKALAEALAKVLDTTVSLAGVDVNRAPVAVLARVAGLGPARAAAIYGHVQTKGALTTRAQLTNVAGIGPKTFRDAAGFLRIEGGPEPLDATTVHPDDYAIARRLLRDAGLPLAAATDTARLRASRLAALVPSTVRRDRLVAELLLGLGEADPRDGRPPPSLRNERLIDTSVKLRVGSVVTSVVRNVTQFGAFVDFGGEKDGLLRVHCMRGRAPDYAVGDVLECVVHAMREGGKVELRKGTAESVSTFAQRPAPAPSTNIDDNDAVSGERGDSHDDIDDDVSSESDNLSSESDDLSSEGDTNNGEARSGAKPPSAKRARRDDEDDGQGEDEDGDDSEGSDDIDSGEDYEYSDSNEDEEEEDGRASAKQKNARRKIRMNSRRKSRKATGVKLTVPMTAHALAGRANAERAEAVPAATKVESLADKPPPSSARKLSRPAAEQSKRATRVTSWILRNGPPGSRNNPINC
jgi:uncharacterized protein